MKKTLFHPRHMVFFALLCAVSFSSAHAEIWDDAAGVAGGIGGKSAPERKLNAGLPCLASVVTFYRVDASKWKSSYRYIVYILYRAPGSNGITQITTNAQAANEIRASVQDRLNAVRQIWTRQCSSITAAHSPSILVSVPAGGARVPVNLIGRPFITGNRIVESGGIKSF